MNSQHTRILEPLSCTALANRFEMIRVNGCHHQFVGEVGLDLRASLTKRRHIAVKNNKTKWYLLGFHPDRQAGKTGRL